MNKEQIYYLVFGLVLGILLMFFWNLGSSLNNQNARLSQLEQVAGVNSQTITEVVNFINTAISPEGTIMPEGSVDLEDLPMIIE